MNIRHTLSALFTLSLLVGAQAAVADEIAFIKQHLKCAHPSAAMLPCVLPSARKAKPAMYA